MASPAALTDEIDLIYRAQQGERSAFAVLAKHYWEGLYRWLYHLTHDQDQAEDLAQESFLRTLTHLATFEPGSNFRAWLFRIAHNQWANQRRLGKRTRLPFPRDLPARGETPAEAAMGREALAQLARAVGRLPSDYRAAFLLRAEEGLSFREIGEVLDIAEETARWRVRKARRKLMQVMGPHLDQP